MRRFLTRRRSAAAVPITVGSALLLAACGSSSSPPVAQSVAQPVAQQVPAPVAAPPAPAPSDESTAKLVKAVVDYLESQSKKKLVGDDLAQPALKKAVAAVQAVQAVQAKQAAAQAKQAAPAKAPTAKAPTAKAPVVPAAPALPDKPAVVASAGGLPESAPVLQTNEQRYAQLGGATDTGVTKDSIKTGTIMMHGMALSRLTTTPQVAGQLAAIEAVNDRGGVLGRRITMVDCDDGPGEVSRTKQCLKKLVVEDKIFSLLTVGSWGSAAIHADLALAHMPVVGAWAYSQTEWQDPYMFPTHMSMIHEAMAAANWAKNTVKPKTYGLVCLASPEMELACDQVRAIMDATGAKLVKKLDVAISETSMSSYVLAMRVANPDFIFHYVINPATMVKFMVESGQQGYWPPLGMQGNHMASEVLGSLVGTWPINRYWTNTTYRLWGKEFMDTMAKYARSSRGTFHHIVQAGYVGVNMFAQAAKEVGPNLTRDRLMTALSNGGVWSTDASLDQRFSYAPAERGGDYDHQTWHRDLGQGREFMYKYTGPSTVSNPDGSPSGVEPDPAQFVIYTDH